MGLNLRGSFRVVAIVKRTKAELFKRLEVGDVVNLRVSVQHLGVSRGRSYAPDLVVSCDRWNDTSHNRRVVSFNQFSNIMNSFTIEPI